MDHQLSIILDNAGRRFNRDWIFRDVTYTFTTGGKYAILGPNGSGKSTLLQLLNGSMAPSSGRVTYQLGNAPIPTEHIYQYLTLAAPYLELIEEFTLNEMIDFHFQFKPHLPDVGKAGIVELLNLKGSANKLIKYFSSGMKQRLKLALAFCSDTPILMLDEPTSNLDTQGVGWYRELVDRFTAGRLLIVCSNQLQEYDFCDRQLLISDYKKVTV